jgi:hypothetical protein
LDNGVVRWEILLVLDDELVLTLYKFEEGVFTLSLSPLKESLQRGQIWAVAGLDSRILQPAATSKKETQRRSYLLRSGTPNHDGTIQEGRDGRAFRYGGRQERASKAGDAWNDTKRNATIRWE